MISSSYSFGTNGNLEHKPAIKEKGVVIAAYSYVKLKDGSSSYEVMNLEEIEAIRKRSKAAGNGPWKTDWNEMAKKTVFRRHSKWLPVSSELMKAAVDKDYDVPIDIMRYAEDAGKPMVTEPKALSDDKEPEKGKTGAPEIKTEKEMIDKKVVHFYEYIDKAGPRSVNGMPCFFSMKNIIQKDWKKIVKYIKEYEIRVKSFLDKKDVGIEPKESTLFFHF